MDYLSFFEHLVRDLLIFVGVCLALLVIALLMVARLPRDNPLRQLLGELCRHLAVTLVAGAAALPVEPIPGLDVAYDTVVPLALLYYWGRFAWRVFAHRNPPIPPARGQSTS